MDLENQSRIKELAEKYGPENLLVILGSADQDAAAMGAETVTAGDPTFVGPLSGAQLGLLVFHALEEEFKDAVDRELYSQNIIILEMVLPVDEIVEKVKQIRAQHSKY